MLDDLYNLSFYKQIAELNKEHGIALVQHIDSGRTFARKEMTVYNKSVYEQLKANPVAGIPKIFEVCENDGVLTIIEEYISGHSLEDCLEKNGTFSEADVVDIIDQLCSILTKIHSFSPAIIHRDIKPSNVMLTDDRRVVLIDLNGAKLENKEQSRDTELIGTHGFAAPEQYGFGASNVQTDIYSVGKLMIVLLTGELDGLGNYKGRLKPVIEKCLCLDPKDRYESAAQLQDALKVRKHRRKKASKHSFLKKFAIAIIAIIVILAIIGNAGSKGDDASSSNMEASGSEQVLEDHGKREAPVSDYIESPVGAYKGDDDEILVIADNGLAYYYCVDEIFTELECPWSVIDDTLTITLYKLHCDIEASTADGCATLIFRSDSLNWNTEEFIWFTADYEPYILDPPPSLSKDVTVLKNGDMQIAVNNVEFTIPKSFMDYGDDYSLRDIGYNGYTFVDNDAASGYIGSTLISSEHIIGKQDLDNNYKLLCEDFASRFLKNVQVGHYEPVTVGGYSGYSVMVSGLLNKGFSKLENTIVSGPVIVVYNDTVNEYMYLLFIQVVGEDRDDTELFNSIIESAKVI